MPPTDPRPPAPPRPLLVLAYDTPPATIDAALARATDLPAALEALRDLMAAAVTAPAAGPGLPADAVRTTLAARVALAFAQRRQELRDTSREHARAERTEPTEPTTAAASAGGVGIFRETFTKPFRWEVRGGDPDAGFIVDAGEADTREEAREAMTRSRWKHDGARADLCRVEADGRAHRLEQLPAAPTPLALTIALEPERPPQR